jgi:hypothetical protein
MYSAPPTKDNNWQTGLKRRMQQSVVYNKAILQAEISLP